MAEWELPLEFLDKCDDEERAEVQSWWQELRAESRDSLCLLLDRRQDARAFVYAAAEEGGEPAWRSLPLVDEPPPSEQGDDEGELQQWEFIQHLLDHEEFIIPTEATIRTFHICTAHPAARKVRRAGHVETHFRCPVAAATCPIRGLFADGTTSACRLIDLGTGRQRMLVIGR